MPCKWCDGTGYWADDPCLHCNGSGLHDWRHEAPVVRTAGQSLPESVRNQDKFAKDFARQILEKYPYKPPPGKRFCGLDGDCRENE